MPVNRMPFLVTQNSNEMPLQLNQFDLELVQAVLVAFFSSLLMGGTSRPLGAKPIE